MTARQAAWNSQSKITSPTHGIFKIPVLCFNCLHNLADFRLFFKQLLHHWIRRPLCWYYSFLFLPHMWRQLSKASTLLDYPTNHQSFCNSWEDESACWIPSRACWCLFFFSPSRAAPGWGPESPHLIIHFVPSLGPGHTPAATGNRQSSEAFWGLGGGGNCRPRWFFLSIGLSFCLSVLHRAYRTSVFCLLLVACTCQDSSGGRKTGFYIQRHHSQACMHATHSGDTDVPQSF